MIRSTVVMIIIILLIQSKTFAQDWINEFLNEGQADPSDIVGSFLMEMENAIGKNAPNIVFEDIKDGAIDSLSNYIGKVVLVNFWHTNCSGCIMQLPELNRLQETYIDSEFIVIYVSSEESTVLSDYFMDNKTEGYKVRVDRANLERPFQLLATPSAFIADSEGVVRDVWIGPEKYDNIKKRIVPYLSSTEN